MVSRRPPQLLRQPLTGGRRWLRAMSLVGVVACWEVAAQLSNSVLMPSATVIAARLAEEATTGNIGRHASVTLQRGLTGFAIAVALGLVVGMWMGRSRNARAVLEPLLAATYPIPRLALYPLLIISLGHGAASKITLVALECFYPIAYNTLAGVHAVPQRLTWTALNAGASTRRVFWSVSLKGAVPQVLAGVRIALPVMLIVMVVTEMLGESVGLGYLIRSASTSFEPDRALAVVAVVGMVGFVLDRVLVSVSRPLAHWEPGLSLTSAAAK